MKIYKEEPSDVARYLQGFKEVTLQDKEEDFRGIMRRIKRFKPIDEKTKILEIGTGIGWFPALCRKKGISCKGLEISPKLVEHARDFGRRYNIEPDIELGNIEENNIGIEEYDVIIASCTFEHVKYWQQGIKRIFDALKQGGLFYFCATNKFSLKSGEFGLPLYGWLPDSWRYRLRIFFQGEDIMKLGIDFNQFNYFQLRRFFKNIGFSNVLDRFEFLEPNNLNKPRPWKKIVLKVLKRFKILRYLGLFFSSTTLFICIK